jgi:hypothetical protein
MPAALRGCRSPGLPLLPLLPTPTRRPLPPPPPPPLPPPLLPTPTRRPLPPLLRLARRLPGRRQPLPQRLHLHLVQLRAPGLDRHEGQGCQHVLKKER